MKQSSERDSVYSPQSEFLYSKHTKPCWPRQPQCYDHVIGYVVATYRIKGELTDCCWMDSLLSGMDV